MRIRVMRRAVAIVGAAFVAASNMPAAAQVGNDTLDWWGASQADFVAEFGPLAESLTVQQEGYAELARGPKAAYLELLEQLARAAPDPDALFALPGFARVLKVAPYEMTSSGDAVRYGALLRLALDSCRGTVRDARCLERRNSLAALLIDQKDFAAAERLLREVVDPATIGSSEIDEQQEIAAINLAFAVGHQSRIADEIALLRTLAATPRGRADDKARDFYRRQLADALKRSGDVTGSVKQLEALSPSANDFVRNFNALQLAEALHLASDHARAETLIEDQLRRLAAMDAQATYGVVRDIGEWTTLQARFRRKRGDLAGAAAALDRGTLLLGLAPDDQVFDKGMLLERALILAASGRESDAAGKLRALFAEEPTANVEDPVLEAALAALEAMPAAVARFDVTAQRAAWKAKRQGQLADEHYYRARRLLVEGPMSAGIEAAHAMEALIVADPPADERAGGKFYLAAMVRFAEGDQTRAAALLRQEAKIDAARWPDRGACNPLLWAIEHPDAVAPPAGGFPGCEDSATELDSFYTAWVMAALIKGNDPAVADTVLPPLRAAIDEARSSRRRLASAERVEAGQADADLAEGRALWMPLFVDSAWAAVRGAPTTERTAEAFVVLQESALDGAAKAVAIRAGETAAASQDPDLARLARDYQAYASDPTRGGPPLITVANPDARVSTPAERAAERRREAAEEKARRAADARFQTISDELRHRFPRYFSLVEPEAVDLAATQAMLAPDEAVLLAVPGRSGTHLVAVSRDRAQWVRSDWDEARLTRAIQRLRWDVGADVGAPEAVDQRWQRDAAPGYSYDRKLAHQLYQQVVAPVAATLAGKRHVMIVASGALAALPFGVLVTAPPAGADGDPTALRATAWFAEAHALTQLPSIQTLLFLREPAGMNGPGPAAAARQVFAGFGDPVFSGRSVEREGGLIRGRRASLLRTASDEPARSVKDLAQLEGASSELEAMRRALGASPQSVRSQAAANEPAVRSADLASVSVLHFATHGVLPGEIESLGEAALALTPPAGDTSTFAPGDDGLLTASEIAGLKLGADWVILSACNTAVTGGRNSDHAFSGLTRAFFYAGARNVLATHWPVRDDVATILTVRAVELAAQDPAVSRAEALQRAMREIRGDERADGISASGRLDTWAHPNAWAPFSLIGDVWPAAPGK